MRYIFLAVFGLTFIYICAAFGADDNSTESKIHEAKEYIIKNKPDEAITILENILKVMPSKKEAHYLKGKALSMQGKFSKAKESFELALSIDRNYIDAQKGKCEAMIALNECSTIPSCYKRLVEIKPTPETRKLATSCLTDTSCSPQPRGSGRFESELYDTALSLYNESIAENKNDTDAWNNKGVALGDLNRLDESIACFDEVLRINGSIAEAWNNKGVSLGKMNKYQEALNSLNQSISLNPKSAEAWYNKAKILSFNDETFEDAHSCYLRATDIDSKFRSRSEMLDWAYKKT